MSNIYSRHHNYNELQFLSLTVMYFYSDIYKTVMSGACDGSASKCYAYFGVYLQWFYSLIYNLSSKEAINLAFIIFFGHLGYFLSNWEGSLGDWSDLLLCKRPKLMQEVVRKITIPPTGHSETRCMIIIKSISEYLALCTIINSTKAITSISLTCSGWQNMDPWCFLTHGVRSDDEPGLWS